jgi:hypothetical protein
MSHHQEKPQIAMSTLVVKNIKNEPSSGGTPDDNYLEFLLMMVHFLIMFYD